MRDTERVISEIQQGNEALREDLIASQKAFIHKYTSFVCKKNLDWVNDDELSIALIAFNTAVDNFKVGYGNSFSTYVRVLIKNSLIDYFRKEPCQKPVSLEAVGRDGRPVLHEEAVSLDIHRVEIEDRDRAFEMEIFAEALSEFGLELEELPAISPSHKDTREYLKSMARRIRDSEELTQRIYSDRKLPLKRIQALTGGTRKTIEKWRKYLLTLIIILTNPDLGMLAEYIRGKDD